MAKTYIWAQDGGHAWLAVKAGELVSLGIQDKISGYSYVKGDTVYLEEDCDAGLFINAYRARWGHDPVTRSGKHWDRWPGRSFNSYSTAWIYNKYPLHA